MIKNFNSLATNKLRKDSLKIIEAGINSVLTSKVMKKKVKKKKNILLIGRKKYNLKKFDKIIVIGVGKAAVPMAEHIEKILGEKIEKGIIISNVFKKLKKIKVIKGGHPIPNLASDKGIRTMLELVNHLTEKDLVLCLISGGGSALGTCGVGANISEKKRLNKLLIRSGAEIKEINTVRKHLSYFKGGNLAKTIWPAKCVSLIFSDVVGNDLSVIASGPTVRDNTTYKKAILVLKKYDLLKKISKKAFNHLINHETPKEKKYFKKVDNNLILTNKTATEAMTKEAKKLGYKVKLLSNNIKGDVKKVANKFKTIKGTAIIAAGEPTVHVTGKGKGGRAQELTLYVAAKIKLPTVFIAVGTDGKDGPTNADGAIVDETTLAKCKRKRINLIKELLNNNTNLVHKKLGSLIKTGNTGTNVGDLMLMISQ